ncbi:MAG: [NiFe]-hydrogenase assembly chaperone HybE [Thiobacillaceae bacterium]|jgi:[NiFe] hydrogenase assembly HybE family chaperone
MHPAVEKLVTDYRDKVGPRMSTLPMYNPALEVEAVDFELHVGRLCGVLVTPWFMNLVLLPGEDDDWSGVAPGKTFKVAFRAGDYHCMLSAPEGIPPHLSLPLFTTLKGFTDQDIARRVAREVLQRLNRDTTDPTAADPVDTDLGRGRLQRPLSRRALLRSLLALKEGEE